MKDLYALENWPLEWIGKVIEDFPKLNRETRIFLAKLIRLAAEQMHKEGKKFPFLF